MRKLYALGICLVLAAGAGCGSSNIVNVSGTVKVDGKPYKNAVVTFQPMGGKSNPNPGRGSAGITDAEGRFSMIYDGDGAGAVVGKHQVRIFTKSGAEVPEDYRAESVPGAKFIEPIPVEWHDKSEKTFEVPAGGTTKADFEIWTKDPKKQ